jgi:hypothetical protein
MSRSTSRLPTPIWGRVPALALAVMCALCLPALAQPKKGKGTPPPAPAGDRAAPTSNTGPASVGDSGTPASDPKSDGKDGKKGKDKGPKTFDFTALDLNGRMRSPQLLYFLERANEELERASLEKRSFIPHMVRSLEEEQL